MAATVHPRPHQIERRKKAHNFSDRYRTILVLGKGNFGKVYLAEDRTNGQQVAVKVVDKRLFKNNDQKQHALREQSICEEFATRLRHKHIVQIYNVISDEECIYVVMEYIQGGELFDRIKQEQKLAEVKARRWFRQIIEAVCFIHENGIVHRDLKPENVLIDRKQRVRLCDFGFGKRIKERHEVLSTYCGSPFYASPEMVTATPYRGPSVDMWSCGVILYAMLTGTLPFQGDDMPQLFRKISQGHFSMPRYISSEAAHLIHRLLCKNPKDRITAADCLLHPWLQVPSNAINAASTVPPSSSASSIPISTSVKRTSLHVHQKHPSAYTSRYKTMSYVAPVASNPAAARHHAAVAPTVATNTQSPARKKLPQPGSAKSSLQRAQFRSSTASTPTTAPTTAPLSAPSRTDSKSNKGRNTKVKPTAAAASPSLHTVSAAPGKKKSFWSLHGKKHTQVVPSSTPENADLSAKKKIKLVELKVLHRFKGFIKHAFQKRIA